MTFALKVSMYALVPLLIILSAPALAQTAEAADSKPPVLAEAPPALPARLLGQWPGNEKPVTLDLQEEKARDAIRKLAEQAGWSVAFKDKARARVDLALHGVPADVALSQILEAADDELIAERKGNLVTIREADESVAAERMAEDGVRDRVSVGGSVAVGEGETVQSAVTVFGDVTVNGTVTEDAVAVLGDVHIGPRGSVKGDVVSVLGGLSIDPRATIGGNRVGVGFSPIGYLPGLSSFSGGIIGKLLQFVLYFVIGLVLLAFFPNRVRVVSRELLRSPALSFGLGFAGAVAVIPLVPLMAATVIGIPFIPVLGLLVIVAVMLGFTSLSMEIGERLTKKRSSALALAIGVAILVALSALPFLLGVLILWGFSVLGFGAVLRTKFGSGPENDANFSPMP